MNSFPCFVALCSNPLFFDFLFSSKLAFVSGRLPFVWIWLCFATHSHTLSICNLCSLPLFLYLFLYAPFGSFLFFLIITTMSVLIGLCIALRVGLRVVAGVSRRSVIVRLAGIGLRRHGTVIRGGAIRLTVVL